MDITPLHRTQRQWEASNEVIPKGVLAVAVDTGLSKLGNGVHKYSELDAWRPQGATGGEAVDSVNGQTGAVVLDAEDVGAVAGLNGVVAVWQGTESEYSGLGATDPNTVYIVLPDA